MNRARDTLLGFLLGTIITAFVIPGVASVVHDTEQGLFIEYENIMYSLEPTEEQPNDQPK